MHTSHFYRNILMLCLCALLALPLACGRKEMPRPAISPASFSINQVEALMSDGFCFSVYGQIDGPVQNVQALFLEIEPVTEACLTCPFLPQQVFQPDITQIWESTQNFRFTACPASSAEGYRYRIVGHNITSGIAPVTSAVQIVHAVQAGQASANEAN